MLHREVPALGRRIPSPTLSAHDHLQLVEDAGPVEDPVADVHAEKEFPGSSRYDVNGKAGPQLHHPLLKVNGRPLVEVLRLHEGVAEEVHHPLEEAVEEDELLAKWKGLEKKEIML